MAARKKVSFEDQLHSVEALIEALENGGLSLDETVDRYEQGIKLIADLERQLGKASQRLTVIRSQADGTYTEEPLEADREDI